MQESAGEWRKLYKEKLHDLHSSTNIIRVIKSRRIVWAGHVARMGEKRNGCRFLVGTPGAKVPLGRFIYEDNVKLILRKYCGMAWAGFIWPTIGIGCCEHGNELSGSIYGEFLD